MPYDERLEAEMMVTTSSLRFEKLIMIIKTIGLINLKFVFKYVYYPFPTTTPNS